VSNKRLEVIGWWFHDLAPSSLPRPQRLVGSWSDSDRAFVVAYLRAGSPIVDYPDPSFCRFDCGETEMGSRDLTDGEFVWPDGLAHYVEKHSVRLPEHFVAHVREREGRIAPFVAPKPRFGLYDRGPWERWGREQGASIDLGAFEVPDEETKLRIEKDLGGVEHEDIVLCCGSTREVVLFLEDGSYEVRQLKQGGAAPRRFASWDEWRVEPGTRSSGMPEKPGRGMTMDAFLQSMRRKHGLDDETK